jgi:hypothetical protein
MTEMLGVRTVSFGEEATKAAVRNPQSTMAVQMVGIAQHDILIAEFGESSAGKVRQGSDGLLHITPPHLGCFTDLPLPGSCGAKRLRLVPGTWWVDSVSFARLCKQEKAQASSSEQGKRKHTPFRSLPGTIKIGRPDRH